MKQLRNSLHIAVSFRFVVAAHEFAMSVNVLTRSVRFREAKKGGLLLRLLRADEVFDRVSAKAQQDHCDGGGNYVEGRKPFPRARK
jgi:hypothetical protein